MSTALSAWQQEVLTLRGEGMGYREIAKRRGCCRQAVQCAERIALAKLGQSQQAVWDAENAERAAQREFYRERGRQVREWELSHDPKEVRLASGYKAARQSLVARLDKIISRVVAELEAGKVSATAAWERIQGLQAEIQAV